jgi:hypothetical protein
MVALAVGQLGRHSIRLPPIKPWKPCKRKRNKRYFMKCMSQILMLEIKQCSRDEDIALDAL